MNPSKEHSEREKKTSRGALATPAAKDYNEKLFKVKNF